MNMDDLVSLCRRRGFIFQSSEIYGGINGFWDYGPLGVELKKNIKEAWWQDMVRNPPLGPDGNEVQMVGVDCSIIMNPKVWEASGHVGGFADPMVNCKYCRKLFRSDQVAEQLMASDWVRSLLDLYPVGGPAPSSAALGKWTNNKGKRLAPNLTLVRSPETVVQWVTQEAEPLKGQADYSDFLRWVCMFATGDHGQGNVIVPCPACGGDLSEPRQFNLMNETYTGAVRDDANKAYLRPETAQGIFVNFRNVLDSTRMKVPFGIGQIGKAFRNEINPRNYIFRSREFEQMEIEFFCHPSTSRMWYEWWRDVRIKWYSTLGIKSGNLRPREQGKEELAFYSVGTTDIEYMFPFSDEPQELEGVAHRGNYDLTQHQKHSGKDLTYFDEEAWERDKAGRTTNSFKEWMKSNPPAADVEKYQYLPHVIEPSAGADRFTLAVLCEAFAEDEIGGEKRTVMRFHPRLAPIKAAVLPLVNKDGMPEKAEALYRNLKKHFNVFYDDKGAVGRRYRRQDEAGTPFCITIDGQTMQDGTVTIRERDSTQQRRIAIDSVEDAIREALI
jgi:glycyl-tRNA synthetase